MRVKLGSRDQYAIVDRSDLSILGKLESWCYFKKPSDKTGYAYKLEHKKGQYYPTGKKMYRKIWMHNLLLGTREVDHINGNGLDNRRCNLRRADRFQQAYNRPTQRNKKSAGIKGVSWVRDKRGISKYCIARITVRGKRIYLGVFKSEIQANKAYVKAAKKYHKEFFRY